MKKQTKIDVLSIMGLVCLTVGIAILNVAASLIVLGAIVLVYCVNTEGDTGRTNEGKKRADR
jgi:lipoprotein signal peptidase